MITFDKLRSNLSHIRIAHHIRGRIRLKLEDIPSTLLKSLPLDHQKQYQTVLGQVPGLHSVRLNLPARSCIVEYDPSVIPYQAWNDFICGTDSASATKLEQILRKIYQELINAKL